MDSRSIRWKEMLKMHLIPKFHYTILIRSEDIVARTESAKRVFPRFCESSAEMFCCSVCVCVCVCVKVMQRNISLVHSRNLGKTLLVDSEHDTTGFDPQKHLIRNLTVGIHSTVRKEGRHAEATRIQLFPPPRTRTRLSL